MGFFDYIENGLSDIGHAIGGAVVDVKDDVESVFHSVGSGITTVYSDIKGGASMVFTTVTNGYKTLDGQILGKGGVVPSVIDDAIGKQGIINNGINKTTGILSMPLILLAAGGAAFLLFSGRNSSFQGQASV